MSGCYIVQTEKKQDLHHIAGVLSSQIACGGEKINHYAISGQTVMGLVSPDKFSKGIMPLYMPETGLWGILMGELHECDYLSAWHADNPGIDRDIEILACLYRKESLVRALPQLNGAFFFILWDPGTKTLVAANDRYGLYPMYWAYSGNGFCLASRMLCPILSGIADASWDLAGVAQFLTTDDYLGETTLIKGVRTFPQASIMIKTGDALKWHTYWHYDYTSELDEIPEEELAEEIGARFLRAVQRQSAGKTRIGITLSGGLDSRLILAAAHKARLPVQTFTWGKADAYDRTFARQAAHLFETEHHDCDYLANNVSIRHEEGIRITEGLINYFDCHMLFHLHILQEHADVILNGYAGDLVLGGSYLRNAWMSAMPETDLAKRLFAWRNTLVPENRLADAVPDLSGLDRDLYPSMLYHCMLSQLNGHMPVPDRTDRFFLENRVRRSTSMGTVLMREAVESAACFFEYSLLDLITQIPYRLRHEHRIYRAMMKQSFPQAMRVRWQRTLLPAYAPSYMDLPAKAFLKGCRILEKRYGWPHISSRQSPVNFAQILRQRLRPWMDSVIRDKHPACDEILKKDFCNKIWEQHLTGHDHTRLLGVIASLRGVSTLLYNKSSGSIPTFNIPIQVTHRT
ncbi:MAG: hypothetical protein JXM72_11095 [Deltaproteobacteria bacterium]|nr:hypothetical protein [Deltaproteobacteria bacterium]